MTRAVYTSLPISDYLPDSTPACYTFISFIRSVVEVSVDVPLPSLSFLPNYLSHYFYLMLLRGCRPPLHYYSPAMLLFPPDTTSS